MNVLDFSESDFKNSCTGGSTLRLSFYSYLLERSMSDTKNRFRMKYLCKTFEKEFRSLEESSRSSKKCLEPNSVAVSWSLLNRETRLYLTFENS